MDIVSSIPWMIAFSFRSPSRGKSFDLEVHVSDPTAARVNEALVAHAEQRAVHDERIEKVRLLCASSLCLALMLVLTYPVVTGGGGVFGAEHAEEGSDRRSRR